MNGYCNQIPPPLQPGEAGSGSLTVGYTYDSQGALLSVTYPTDPAAATCTYTLDAMERPTAMTDNQSFPWASGVTYNAANQPLGGTFELSYSASETRTYNNLLQLTHVPAGDVVRRADGHDVHVFRNK
jgi:YD repeat-containing protein